jgi:hypothetical protein
MNEYYDTEIDRLHEQLASIYRRGALTSTEKVTADGLWARIEKLEATKVKIEAKESKRNGG